MPSAFLIAEAASAHDGDFVKAADLIRLAADTKWDAVKFQFWSSAERLAERRNAQDYLPIYQKYQMPREWLPKLKALADAGGLEFMCTAYLEEDIPVVAEYVSRFKVASFEAGRLDFIRAHYEHDTWNRKPIIVSTGMMDYWDVVRLLERCPRAMAFLACTSAYPCSLDEVNLGSITTMRSLHRTRPPYGYAPLPITDIGYSDHTAHPLTGAFAVCAGAQIVEAHIRLWSTSPQNPDYPAALDPDQAREYVANIRLAERMLGDGVKQPQPCEKAMMAYRVRS